MPLELEHVSWTYRAPPGGEIPVLRDLSLRVEEGEFLGIMGRTGCGKSTLIQLMAGLLRPEAGRVLLDGEDINQKGCDRSLLRRRLGLVFQYPEYQLFETTVEKDVAFGLKHSGLKKAEIAGRVEWALETLGFSFDVIRSQPPLALSGGEKRRVAIAGVLASKPKILIFDEPVAGLDPQGREAFLRLLDRLNREGTTIIMVSHNADALGEFARRIVVLENGSLVLDGPPGEVFSDVPKIKALGLGVSSSREIACALTDRGLELSRDIVDYAGLLEALKLRLAGTGEAGR